MEDKLIPAKRAKVTNDQTHQFTTLNVHEATPETNYKYIPYTTSDSANLVALTRYLFTTKTPSEFCKGDSKNGEIFKNGTPSFQSWYDHRSQCQGNKEQN